MTDIIGLTGSDTDERVVAKSALEAAEEQLRSLCASHAGTFVSVERRGTALETALQNLLLNCKTVEDQVISAQQSLEQEEDSEKSLAALSEKHRVRRRTLLQHSSLLELLELPSLMDACVRSNLYEEALSITAFANTLERRHTEKNAVVVKVIAQIRSRQADLRRHLLHCLKNQVTMPECLEIVTALRRLNSIDLERQSETNLERVHAAMELALQVDFIEARDVWLDQPINAVAIGSIGRQNTAPLHSSEQLLDTIERYRTRMFEIATQFNAIFRAQASAQQVSVSLLSMWTSRRVHSFLVMLKNQLDPMEDSASVRDAMDACIFFAASIGRLGADFTAQLPPLFESKMQNLVTQFWSDGASQLAETLKICREAGISSPLSSTVIAASTTTEGADSESTTLQAPPRQLMALPPLGRFVNAVLTGLNELRRCLLPGLCKGLRSDLQQVLKAVEDILQANERAVMTPGLRGEAVELRLVAKEMHQVLVDIVNPYCRGALEASIGSNASAKELFNSIVLAEEEPEKMEEPEKEDDNADAAGLTPSPPEETEGVSTPTVPPTSQEASPSNPTQSSSDVDPGVAPFDPSSDSRESTQ